MPYLGAVCRRLGVDYAPALTGFDSHRGRSVPRLEGIVICEEHREAVEQAYLELQRCGSGWVGVEGMQGACAV